MARKSFDVAVIGDHFMRPDFFERALEEIALPDDVSLSVRTMTQPWPDEPMAHGYAGEADGDPRLAGLREFMGSPDEVNDFVGDARALITQLAPVTASLVEQCRDLEFIGVTRGGPVNVDTAAVHGAGIKLVNTPGRNADAVAEFTIGAILAETRLIRVGHEALRQGVYRGDLYRADTTGRELGEMTVGVIGYGHVGTRVVRLLKPFGCKLLVCDPYVQLTRDDADSGVSQCDLDTLLGAADVVTLHSRVTSETAGFIGARQFAAMREGAYFINTARGPMVDYDALHDALVSGHLGGAMLETFAIEPPPADWALLKLPNVTLTPHIAGASVRVVSLAAGMVAEDLRRHLAGEPPVHLIPHK